MAIRINIPESTPNPAMELKAEHTPLLVTRVSKLPEQSDLLLRTVEAWQKGIM